jgi:Polyketide cyclase / dehydrase and lipid transport
MSVFLLLLLALAAFLFWVSRKPDEFRLERQITINAPPEKIFPWLNNLKMMNQWNPWSTQDPKSVISYAGPAEGPGASYSWAGGKMGQGRFTILDTKFPGEVNCRLEMIKPMKATNAIDYRITGAGNGTTIVAWPMTGKRNLATKLMHTFMNMDKMVGGEFEKGLSSLKTLVEADQK